MQELRLVGVDEDGGHLLLSGEGGAAFRLPINEALRMASTRPFKRPVQQEPSDGEHKQPPLSPRDIQSRIRSGATAEDIVEETGVDLKHVLRYEGPVRAEREYMAQLAQRVEVASPAPSSDGYRSAFGDNPAQLEDMVRFRLQAYGVDPNSAEWDAWRKPDGLWTVVVRFELPQGSTASVGEEPPAQWTFNPSRRTVLNANRWAQVLSEMEPLDGPLPSRRLSAVADRVFDFETDAPQEEAGSANPVTAGSDPDDDSNELLDVLRSRRGQRLGSDEDADDALALMLAKGHIPAAHPREGEGLIEDEPDVPETRPFPGLSLAPSIFADGPEETYDDGSPRLFDGVSTHTREISIIANPKPSAGNGASGRHGGTEQLRDTPDKYHSAEGEASPKPDPDRKIRPRRSSVPSWDEIVFGTKGD